MSTAELEVPAVEEIEAQTDDAEAPPVEDNPASYTAREQAHYEEIRKAERYVRDKEREMGNAHEEYKAAKREFESADEELRVLIARGPEAQMRLALETDEPQEQPAEAWRAVTIDELGFGGRIHKALTEANLTTLGAIADWTKEYQLTDIGGIGPAAGLEIEEKLADYWAKNPLPEEATAESNGQPHE